MIKTTSKYELCQIEDIKNLNLVLDIGKSVSQIGLDQRPVYRQNGMFAGKDSNGVYHPIGHRIIDGKLTRYYKDLPWSAFVVPHTGIPYIAQVDITKLDARLAFYSTPQILSNGVVSVNSIAENTASDIKSGSNYRSLLGITKVGTVCLVRTFVKLTLQQAGQLMKDLGYYNALNLDGGGSVSGGVGLYDHGYERPVSSALVVSSDVPIVERVEAMRQNDIRVSENFMLYEFESPDTHEVIVHQKLIECLQRLRNKYGLTIINSGYRTLEHNKKVGGVFDSQHRYGKAVDIHLKSDWTPERLADLAKECGFTGIGLYKTFVHMDIRDTPVRFDNR